MNSKLTKLIGALSIATLATVGCKSSGDSQPAQGGDSTQQGAAGTSCGGATTEPTDGSAGGGAGSSCGGH